MTLEEKISALFLLDDETWMRHASPWSVWTRFTALPLLVLAFWSRVYLGWGALVPVILALLWTYYNPRIFSRPASTDNWASKGVFGERVWANRDKIPVPDRHRRLPNVLNGIAAVGGLLVIWGTYALDVWPLLLGFALVYLGKVWYLDRMVRLYEDMRDMPEYSAWLY